MMLLNIFMLNIIMMLCILTSQSTSYLSIWKKYTMNWIEIESVVVSTTLWDKQTSLSMSSTSTLWSYSVISNTMIAFWWMIFRIKSTIACRILCQYVSKTLLHFIISRSFFRMWIINSESTISYAVSFALSSSKSLSYLINVLLLHYQQWWLW